MRPYYKHAQLKQFVCVSEQVYLYFESGMHDLPKTLKNFINLIKL